MLFSVQILFEYHSYVYKTGECVELLFYGKKDRILRPSFRIKRLHAMRLSYRNLNWDSPKNIIKFWH